MHHHHNEIRLIYNNGYKTKQKRKNKCCWRCGETGILIYWWWECKMGWLLQKTVRWFLMNLNIVTIWPSNSTSRYVSKGTKSRYASSYVHASVYPSIIHNTQKVETTQVFINRWMDKQNVVHTYNEMLFSHNQKWSSDTCYNMYESWKHHYAKWKKPDTKGYYKIPLHEQFRICKFRETKCRLEVTRRASLVAQWLRICLPMQATRVRALVWEDPTCRGATRPVSHNYWAGGSGACAPQQERPRQWEARAPRWRVAPARRN